MKYSIIIPVYNRPDEVDELLESLTHQSETDFEVVVVEDGSAVPCQEVCEKYAQQLNIQYFTKPNSGPGQTRNYGVERAQGDYVLILDSDVVLPESDVRFGKYCLDAIHSFQPVTNTYFSCASFLYAVSH